MDSRDLWEIKSIKFDAELDMRIRIEEIVKGSTFISSLKSCMDGGAIHSGQDHRRRTVYRKIIISVWAVTHFQGLWSPCRDRHSICMF